MIGAVFTSLFKTIDLYSYFYALFLTPLFLFSGIFFPVSRFPGGETIAWCTPLDHTVRVVRSMAQGTVGGSTLVSVVWTVLATVLLYSNVPGRMRRLLSR